jgi:hypothetical protein
MPTARVRGAATRAKSAEMCMVAVLVVVEVVLRGDLDDEDLNGEILRSLYTVLWLTLTRCHTLHIDFLIIITIIVTLSAPSCLPLKNLLDR